MFGGTLTLIGTSTNILASELAGDLARQNPARYGALREFTMFEFTQLGVVVLVVGSVYLMTVGRWLTPARIKPESDLTEEFEMADYLTEVVVREDSPLVGDTVRDALMATDLDVDLVQLIRDGEVFLGPLGPKVIRAGDVFALRTDRDTLVELLDTEGWTSSPTSPSTRTNSRPPRSARTSSRWSSPRLVARRQLAGLRQLPPALRRLPCWPSAAAANSSAAGWTRPSSASATRCSSRGPPTASTG